MNLLVKFSRSGALCYCSHLDLLRCVQRTLRRAGLPVQYSQGFNPHPILTFAQAMSVGLSTRGDYFAVGLTDTMNPQAFVQRFNSKAPGGLIALRARAMDNDEKSPMAIVKAAVYRLQVGSDHLADLQKGVQKFLLMDSCLQTARQRTIDIRPLVYWIHEEQDGVLCCVSCGNENLSHSVLLHALSELSGIERDDIKIYRDDLLTKLGSGALVSLFDMRTPPDCR